jgi:lysophospholipase L1-like esterase
MDGLVTWMFKVRQMSSAKRFARSILMRILVVTAVVVTFVGCNQVVTAAHSAKGSGSPGDPNIKYIGRWDLSSPTVRISHWPGAYFKTIFTGKTVKIKLAGSAHIYVSIDHGPYTSYTDAQGTVDLTPKSLKPARTHSLLVASATEYDLIQFEGLVLDPGAKTVAPTESSKLIEFIGDSITAGGRSSQWAVSGYAWVIGQRLSVEHTQIAQGGIPLTYSPNGVGMSTQYFKMATTYFPNSPDWNFSRYQANALVINLGTCDGNVSDATFQSTYITFLQNIRKRYPHAHIFVLRIFVGGRVPTTMAAVQAVRAAGDRNVQYVDTTGWISPSDTVDGVHPSAAGHIKIANHLGPIIASAIGLGKSWRTL